MFTHDQLRLVHCPSKPELDMEDRTLRRRHRQHRIQMALDTNNHLEEGNGIQEKSSNNVSSGTRTTRHGIEVRILQSSSSSAPETVVHDLL